MSPAAGGDRDRLPDVREVPPGRADGRVSLLGSSKDSLDPPSSDPSQRTSAPSLRSDHSRHHELVAPTENFDESRAETICADVVRDSLRDLAPALLLLPRDEARRLRILLAWARTLFDFTDDRSLEGERLTQINRWQFATEQSLDGEPPGQPIFVMFAAEERRSPWNRSALDRFGTAARRRISRPRSDQQARRAEARWLVESVFLDCRPREENPATVELVTDLLLAWQLLGDPADLAYRRPDLASADAPAGSLDQALLRTLCSDLVQRLRSARPVPATRARRRALSFARRSAIDLLEQLSRGSADPRVGLGRRLRFLLAARLGA